MLGRLKDKNNNINFSRVFQESRGDAVFCENVLLDFEPLRHQGH